MTGPSCVFFGTPEFAVPSLEALLRVASVSLVVTQPDRPAGRGRRVAPSPVKQAALEMGIEVVQPASMRDVGFVDKLRAAQARFFFVTAFGRLLPRAILDIPQMGCVNLHASLLPRHRGAAPVQWAILSGDEETGLCLMRMDEGMDTGPVIASTTMPLGQNETAGELSERLAMASGAFIASELPRYISGELEPVAQEGEATLAPRLSKTDGLIDWTAPAEQVVRHVRAMTPWPGARTCMGDRQACIRSVRIPPPDAPEPSDGPAGSCFSGDGRMLVRCGRRWIEILEIQATGKRCMSASDFLRGCRLGPCVVMTREPAE
ncbi:MAG: methionyl-tRNA formyltransferase [Deltaproteobacteria bacterium]|nr:methionyl-tRNA formyltransferase [Deltaproteobacteria bacterium]